MDLGCCAAKVVQAPLSDSSMDSWVPLFVPPPGITIKDMEVIGDFCVLTARTPANEYLLTVIPLKQPKDVYYLEVRMINYFPLISFKILF